MGNLSLAHLAQSKPLTWIRRLSRSENALPASGLEDPAGGPLGTPLDSFPMDAPRDTGAPQVGGRWV